MESTRRRMIAGRVGALAPAWSGWLYLARDTMPVTDRYALLNEAVSPPLVELSCIVANGSSGRCAATVHLATPDPATVAWGVEALLDACPPLLEHLDELQFGAYAGVKQNVNNSRIARLCEPLEGVPNLVLALPSVIGGAWLNARVAVDIVSAAVDPGGTRRIPVAGNDVELGEVIERTADFEWLSWEAFREEYPSIDA